MLIFYDNICALIFRMKLLSDHLLNLKEYALCKGFISPFDKIEKGIYIETAIYIDFYKDLVFKIQDEYFGLHFGFFLNLKALGSVYNISLATTNIGQTINLWSDYSDNNFPIVKFKSYVKENRFYLELSSEIEDLNIRNHILDTIFTFVYRELKLMLKNEAITIHLPFKNLDIYSKWFDATITHSDKHSFSFNENILTNEINANNKKSIELLLPKFLTMLESKGYINKKFSILVRKMILNMCNPELPNLEQVSKQFLITERTLQRKLKLEKMSFRIITNDIKEELAFYLKKGKKIKTKDIAFILGYSCSSSFLHANQNWVQKRI